MSVPEEPGIYLDCWGNVWRKWRDGVFALLSQPEQKPDGYAPFIRMVPEREDR